MIETLFYLLSAIFLLVLNAFFVLAEFASVKARPTQMEALADKGSTRAKKVLFIQSHLDQFLSVCQIGITLASIGLGFIGEPAVARLIKTAVAHWGITNASEATIHGIAIAIAYLLVSYLHIVIGEAVPKSVAIRKTERAALFTVYPMLFFYYLFIIPLWILNSSANLILTLLRIPPDKSHTLHSEDEVRIILDQSQSSGMMSFRRLLFIENVLDMGSLAVRNAMQVKSRVAYLKVDASMEEVNALISRFRYSRYPVVDTNGLTVLGFLHIKDCYLAVASGKSIRNLRDLLRPCFRACEGDLLENVLSEMQKKGSHLAAVYDTNRNWTGIITLEDVIEEVVGTIEEEFPLETAIRLSSFLTSAGQVVPDVDGSTIVTATRHALHRIDPKILPLPMREIMSAIIEREKAGSSYVGKGLAIPHARLKNITNAVVIVARLKKTAAISTISGEERLQYVFILLTPSNAPRLHQILLARIAGIFESGFLEARLEDASSAQEIYEAICSVEQATDMKE